MKKKITMDSVVGLPDKGVLIINKGGGVSEIIKYKRKIETKSLWQWIKGWFKLQFRRKYLSSTTLETE